MDDLSQASHRLSEKVYQQATQAQGAARGGGETPPGGAESADGTEASPDDVVDAEFEVEEEKS
jgi:hypothetical protein